jgi:hypothetical protein
MYGRVRLSSDYSEIKIRLKFAPDAPAPNFEPDWNKPPTALMLVAIRSVDGKRVAKMMKWGLIPHWAKDDKIQYSTRNARSEEFRTKPAFRDASRHVASPGASDARIALEKKPTIQSTFVPRRHRFSRSSQVPLQGIPRITSQ